IERAAAYLAYERGGRQAEPDPHRHMPRPSRIRYDCTDFHPLPLRDRMAGTMMMPMKAPAAPSLPVLILNTGNPDQVLRQRHGDYAQMLRHAAGLEPRDTHIVRAHHGEQPLDPSAYRAALITGSPAMITDREPWSERAAAWLEQAARAG